MSLYDTPLAIASYSDYILNLLRDCETARNAVLKDAEVCAIYKDGALHVADKIADYECRLTYDATNEHYDLVADESDRIYNSMVEWESLPKERGRYTDETLAAFWTAYNAAAGTILSIARKYLNKAKESARIDEEKEPKLIGETWAHRSQLANSDGDILEYSDATHDYLDDAYTFLSFIDRTFPHIFEYPKKEWQHYYDEYLSTGIYAQIRALEVEADALYSKIRYTAGD